MTNTHLLFLYLAGFIASIYIGMRIEAWRWGKRIEHDMIRAYNRGWKAGRDFIAKIDEEKTHLTSAVRVLTGEEGYDADAFSHEQINQPIKGEHND